MAYLEASTDMMITQNPYFRLSALVLSLFILDLMVFPHFHPLYFPSISVLLILGLILMWFRQYAVSILLIVLAGLWGMASYNQSPYMLALYIIELIIANRVVSPDVSENNVFPLVLFILFCVLLNNAAESVLALMSGTHGSTLLELLLVILPLQVGYSIIISVALYHIVKRLGLQAK